MLIQKSVLLSLTHTYTTHPMSARETACEKCVLFGISREEYGVPQGDRVGLFIHAVVGAAASPAAPAHSAGSADSTRTALLLCAAALQVKGTSVIDKRPAAAPPPSTATGCAKPRVPPAARPELRAVT